MRLGPIPNFITDSDSRDTTENNLFLFLKKAKIQVSCFLFFSFLARIKPAASDQSLLDFKWGFSERGFKSGTGMSPSRSGDAHCSRALKPFIRL